MGGPLDTRRPGPDDPHRGDALHDFLVVKGTTTERHDQHAEIIEVRAQDGSPPYVVWSG